MRSDLEALLLNCRNLPSPPGVALRIIELAQDPDVVMATAADTIGLDAALSARMLRIANSPLYASRRRVDNLSQALTLLGLNATLTLALGFSLAQGPRGGHHPAAQERVWRRSVIAALASRLLGQRVGLRKLEELMLAGLLQDIGMLALLQVHPDDYAVLLARHADDRAGLREAERERFGSDHAAVGDWMARHWNLPALLQTAISESESDASSHPFHACVAVSGLVADIWLAADPAATHAAHQRAAAESAARLGLDELAFVGVIEQMATMLPEICALFDIPVSAPARIEALLDQARELLVVRNLREIQDAARARKDADESESRARRLAEEVRRDPLTGVYNRGQLETVLEKEFETATRHGWPLSIAFIDLDDFKQVNDRWGHLVGDEVLRTFAQALVRHVRSSDIVARYGGEEFLIVLPGIGEDAAAHVVRRILADVSGLAMAHPAGAPLYITFSAGLATQGTLDQYQDVDDLLRAADEALYGAKREGRNRVAVGATMGG
ncbi:GGDEF domain-containing protein [Pseudoxanthomonas sp. SL93]|uniref:GGDEF domain-containing protein n=1 Tax=Pseudoxanthomonas sp. SL93 TaxID=2995142 RepID=UPI002271831E|nr:GGDEF domain-containing protein [Pseudoxanthomonas sp. SL93]WAC63416.1 GGDEF domain-containing protein [Pseudoxanthomonas sp. SL93]